MTRAHETMGSGEIERAIQKMQDELARRQRQQLPVVFPPRRPAPLLEPSHVYPAAPSLRRIRCL
jgi:hypothetical protein